ncbi:MAG: hypothetical protein ACI9XZ_003889, partial [Alphaproteobacteria bacterium]
KIALTKCGGSITKMRAHKVGGCWRAVQAKSVMQ